MTRGYPPEHEDGLRRGLEPLPSIAQRADVRALVDILMQGFERLPYRHVHDDQRIRVDADGRGIAPVRLEPPDESRTPVGEGVDPVELRAETLHDGIVDGSPHAGDVELRQVVAGRVHAFLQCSRSRMIPRAVLESPCLGFLPRLKMRDDPETRVVAERGLSKVD